MHDSSQFEMAHSVRAQMTILASMRAQYGSKGLKSYLVDSSYLVNNHFIGKEILENFMYDWKLTSIPLLVDNLNENVTGDGVNRLPTTFLISKQGIITQRWDNMAIASQLATAIESQLGRSVEGQKPDEMPVKQAINDTWSTQAQLL